MYAEGYSKQPTMELLFYYHDTLVKMLVEYAVLDIWALNFPPVCWQIEFGSGLE